MEITNLKSKRKKSTYQVKIDKTYFDLPNDIKVVNSVLNHLDLMTKGIKHNIKLYVEETPIIISSHYVKHFGYKLHTPN
jgi:hypothetical protein